MLKKSALIFGLVFTVIGILGFVPGITWQDENGMDMLLGIFHVDAVHNLVHLASGLLGLLAARQDNFASLYLRSLGVIYAIMTIAGFLQSTTILGLVGVNLADNVLHLILASAMLGVGFGVRPQEPKKTGATAD